MEYNRGRPILVLGLLLAWCAGALALDPSLDVNQYAHRSWKVSDGYFKGTIHAIAQTPDGYIWLATEFGLVRFDGVRTVPWQPPPGEYLPSSDIRNLIAASDGTLWLGTAKGLVSWKNGILTHYPQFDEHDVSTLLQDREGTVWASGTIWESGPSKAGNTALCAIKGGRVQCYGQDGSFGGYGVTTAYEDSRGNLWLGAANGLWRWKPGPPEHYPQPGLKLNGMTGLLYPRRALLEADDGALLVVFSGIEGIFRFADGKLQPYPTAPFSPHFYDGGGLFRDHEGSIWMETTGGGILHSHQGRIDVFDQSDGLSTDTVENILEDREGNIWIATRAGLDCFHAYGVPTFSVKQGLSSPFVRSVLAAEDGSIWLATPNGLNRWKDGHVTIYRTPPAGARNLRSGGAVDGNRRLQPANPPPDTQRAVSQEMPAPGLPGNEVGSLYMEAHGRLWISTAQGIAYFENGKFTPLPQLHIPSWSLSPVALDTSGNLWITSDQGLYRLSGGRPAEYFPSEKLGLHGLLATLLVTDPVRGGMWVGSWAGGVVYFKDGTVRASFGPANGLGAGRVNALHLDRENALWAATDGGLSRVKDARVATLTSKNGLLCDTAHEVMEDDEHSLWLYMACGLVRIPGSELDSWIADPHRQIKVAVFDTSDGVKSHAGVYNFAPRMTKARDGRIWFMSLDGVSVIDPRRLPLVNRLPPPVHIEQVVADHKLYWQNLKSAAPSGLHLPALTRDFAIDYTALSLVAPENVHFKYKLEGQDVDWREVINDREVQYSNLAPGRYRFRVIACNNSGVWNQEGAVLEFSIDPAFYQTTWFVAGCIVLLLTVVWAAWQGRLRQLHHQFEITLDARLRERTRIAREIHDTLLQSFHGVLLHLQVLSQVLRECPEEAQNNLDKTIERAANAITEGRDAVQGLRDSTIQRNDLARALSGLGVELAGDTATPGSAGFRITLEGQPRQLHPIVRDEIYHIAAEAVRNAFSHARAKSIEVEICYGDDQFRLRVRDDGKGIDPAILSGKSREGHYGLQGMRERATGIGGKLAVRSELNAGTELEFTIPGPKAYTGRGQRFRLSRMFSAKR